MGMTLARNLTRQVVAQAEADEARVEAGEPEPPRRGLPVDPALSFSRISRAVRLTLALEARTHQAIEDRARRGAAANDDGPEDDEPMSKGGGGPIDYEAIRRRHAPMVRAIVHGEQDHDVRRAVEETIEDACDDPEDVERLMEELSERLEEDEVFNGRNFWPTGEVIALICQDLGLTPDWDRWRSRGWARRRRKRVRWAPPTPPNRGRRRRTTPFPTAGRTITDRRAACRRWKSRRR